MWLFGKKSKSKKTKKVVVVKGFVVIKISTKRTCKFVVAAVEKVAKRWRLVKFGKKVVPKRTPIYSTRKKALARKRVVTKKHMKESKSKKTVKRHSTKRRTTRRRRTVKKSSFGLRKLKPQKKYFVACRDFENDGKFRVYTVNKYSWNNEIVAIARVPGKFGSEASFFKMSPEAKIRVKRESAMMDAKKYKALNGAGFNLDVVKCKDPAMYGGALVPMQNNTSTSLVVQQNKSVVPAKLTNVWNMQSNNPFHSSAEVRGVRARALQQYDPRLVGSYPRGALTNMNGALAKSFDMPKVKTNLPRIAGAWARRSSLSGQKDIVDNFSNNFGRRLNYGFSKYF